jgi:hypothetical protein
MLTSRANWLISLEMGLNFSVRGRAGTGRSGILIVDDLVTGDPFVPKQLDGTQRGERPPGH